MSPLPMLHHDIMTIVGVCTYRQYVIYRAPRHKFP